MNARKHLSPRNAMFLFSAIGAVLVTIGVRETSIVIAGIGGAFLMFAGARREEYRYQTQKGMEESA